MITKYEQLKTDLAEAVEKAKYEAMTTDEGGTCNLDSCVLFLPRYNEEKTIEAMKEARSNGYKSRYFGKVGYLVSNPISAQGNSRTAQAEKICEVMRAKGYSASVYYMMD